MLDAGGQAAILTAFTELVTLCDPFVGGRRRQTRIVRGMHSGMSDPSLWKQILVLPEMNDYCARIML